ncbi:MAG TPA: hypothetical protein VGR37_10040 [Longimicrobiaceae bacterium]|nr:hypothetical protein [Longimicrobiaceae bacterium]
MDRIRLPLVSSDTPLRDAFSQMARANVPAMIVRHPDRMVLLTDKDISQALESDRPVDAGAPTGSIQSPLPPLNILSGPENEWEAALDRAQVSFGVLEPQETAVLITRHETLAAEIRNAGPVCRCVENLHRTRRGEKECEICGSEILCVPSE